MKCGFAVTDITPPFSASLFGYPGPERVYNPDTDVPLDALEARALYVESGDGTKILIIVLDLCILMTTDAAYCRESLSAQTGIPVNRIFLSCTHTHSAPLARMGVSVNRNDPENAFIQDPEKTANRYGKWLLGKIAEAGEAAIASKEPATLTTAESFSRMGYNRRCASESGIVHCWNLQDFPDRIPQAEPRTRCSVVKFYYTQRAGGIVWGINGIHPVVMGKESSRISADWPIYARREIEHQAPGYSAIISSGAGAQVQPWISTQSNPAALPFIGNAIAREILETVPQRERTKPFEDGLKAFEEGIPGTRQTAAFIDLGEHLLVTLPLELSVTLAEDIISGSSRKLTFLCLCNGWDGYWMSAGEFQEGGYEVEVAKKKRLTPEHSERLKQLIWKHAQ